MDAGYSLYTFRTKLVQEIRTKEKELSELKGKLESVDEVLEMMKENPMEPIVLGGVESYSEGLYSGLGAKAAVQRLLLDHPDKEWGVREVRDTLIANGFKPTTKHIYSVLSTTLDRLVYEGFVNLEKTDEGKRYRKITGSVIQTALAT